MREWLVGLVGPELADKALYLVVAAVVLFLLLGVIWIAKKALGGSIGPRSKGRGPRLAVMDVTAIDPKRKLVLVRRDEVEHLILVGGQNDIVVEAGILRIPASARAPRAEPSLRAEPEAIESGRPSPARSGATVASQARPRSQPETDAVGVPGARTASPLARTIPRAAPAAVRQASAEPERTPQTQDGRPAPHNPVVREARQAGNPTARIEPSIDQERRAAAADGRLSPADAPVVPVPPVEAGANAVGGRVEPQLARADFAAPSATDAAPVDAVAPHDRRPEQGSLAATPAQSEPAASSAFDEVSAGPPAPIVTPQPAPIPRRQPITAASGPPRPPVRPIQRVAIGGVEPVRRPSQEQAPQQATVPTPPRSMATPTYPVRPPVSDPGAPISSENDAPIDRLEPASPAGGQSAEPAQPSPSSVVGDTVAASLGGGRSGPSSPIIAAAERQQDLIRSRGTPPSPSPSPSHAAAPPMLDSGGGAMTTSGVAPAAEDAGEKRPLSVRSFATVIQTRKPSYEAPIPPAKAASAPQRIEPEILLPPPVELPAPETATDGGRRGSPEGRAGALEEFLSAELDSDFAETEWPSAERAPDPAPAVQPVKSEPRASQPEAVAPVGADRARPRVLTLEEEMERLLGDFDFETSKEDRAS